MDKKSWGWHLSVDAGGCNLEKISDPENIHKFVEQLVTDIDMVAYGAPQIVRFGSGDKEGYTLVQLIETSNINAHFAEDLRAVFLDVFSCKEFQNDIVLNLIGEYFDAESFDISFSTRGV